VLFLLLQNNEWNLIFTPFASQLLFPSALQPIEQHYTQTTSRVSNQQYIMADVPGMSSKTKELNLDGERGNCSQLWRKLRSLRGGKDQGKQTYPSSANEFESRQNF
jgi:hypothetical protein